MSKPENRYKIRAVDTEGIELAIFYLPFIPKVESSIGMFIDDSYHICFIHCKWFMLGKNNELDFIEIEVSY